MFYSLDVAELYRGYILSHRWLAPMWRGWGLASAHDFIRKCDILQGLLRLLR